MTDEIANLERLIAKIDDVIASLPERGGMSDYECWKAYRAAEREAFSRLITEEKGRTRQKSDAIHLTFAGVSTSCTCSEVGALHNWKSAARRRIEKLRSAIR